MGKMREEVEVQPYTISDNSVFKHIIPPPPPTHTLVTLAYFEVWVPGY